MPAAKTPVARTQATAAIELCIDGPPKKDAPPRPRRLRPAATYRRGPPVANQASFRRGTPLPPPVRKLRFATDLTEGVAGSAGTGASLVAGVERRHGLTRDRRGCGGDRPVRGPRPRRPRRLGHGPRRE